MAVIVIQKPESTIEAVKITKLRRKRNANYVANHYRTKGFSYLRAVEKIREFGQMRNIFMPDGTKRKMFCLTSVELSTVLGYKKSSVAVFQMRGQIPHPLFYGNNSGERSMVRVFLEEEVKRILYCFHVYHKRRTTGRVSPFWMVTNLKYKLMKVRYQIYEQINRQLEQEYDRAGIREDLCDLPKENFGDVTVPKSYPKKNIRTKQSGEGEIPDVI